MSVVLRQRQTRDAEQEAAKDQIRPGKILYGYCQGRFGRDRYSAKKVTAVGEDTITVRDVLNEYDTPDAYKFGPEYTSFQITDWVGLVESSNNSLQEWEIENDY